MQQVQLGTAKNSEQLANLYFLVPFFIVVYILFVFAARCEQRTPFAWCSSLRFVLCLLGGGVVIDD